MTTLTAACALLGVVILLLILGYIAWRGLSSISIEFLTDTPKPVGEGGGIGNAILGTLILLALASVIGLPLGIAAGVYLSEFGRGWFAGVVRFIADTLTGVPSIVTGVFVYTLVVIPARHFSALAGGIALGIIMIPIVTRTTEEMLRLVPASLREGALALGAPQWRVTTGVVMAFIGPSGCGKSTFLRALNRMNDTIPGTRAEGEVLIDGGDVYAPGTDVVELRRKVGMVFQKSNPFPKSIFDNVAYGLRINRLTGSKSELQGRVEEALKDAALWSEVKDRLKSSALGLSGGQQQRLCIARALAVRPEVVLMDEPASALDPIATQKIEELIVELKRQYTIVIVTHNMQQAARVSDRTAFFWLGKLVEVNDTEKMFTNPDEKLTEDYITGRFG